MISHGGKPVDVRALLGPEIGIWRQIVWLMRCSMTLLLMGAGVGSSHVIKGGGGRLHRGARLE